MRQRTERVNTSEGIVVIDELGTEVGLALDRDGEIVRFFLSHEEAREVEEALASICYTVQNNLKPKANEDDIPF